MRKLLTFSIPIVLGVGLLAAALNDTDDKPLQQAGAVTNTTLPAVIEGEPGAETTTTTAAPAPAPEPEPTTTTTAAPATTTTTRRAATPTTARQAPTTTTTAPAPQQAAAPAPSTVDCGTGSASAVAKLTRNGSAYAVAATVTNHSTKAIQLDSLLVRAVYNGVEKIFTVEVGGRVVESGGGEMTFEIPESAQEGPPSSFDISEFKFHTAGLPQCASR